MPTQPYHTKAGEKVPGVTTVLGHLGWKTNGLMFWAHAQGAAGKDLRETRDALAEAGTLTHLMASCDIKGEPQPDLSKVAPEIREKAEASFKAYLAWKASTRLELVASEVPLVSEAMKYGGCLDAVAIFDGAAGLLDFKSSKDLYPDAVVQVAAYWKLWEECNPDLPLSHWHILRWAPDGGFNHHSLSLSQVRAGWEVFEHVRAIYDLRKVVKA